MENLLKLLTGPWTCLIIWNLSRHGPSRFLELKRRVGKISSKVLTERLRMLESAGMIYRHYEQTMPPQVTYGLAARGEELRRVFAMLQEVAAHLGDMKVKKSHNRHSGRDRCHAGLDISEAAE